MPDAAAVPGAEDLVVGSVTGLGTYTVTREEILAFAGHWDPQALHLDDEYASTHEFGEIIASGLHTLGVYQRLAVLGAYRHWPIIAGRAIRDVQLTYAVRAGTTLRGEVEVAAVVPKDPTRALVTTYGRLYAEEHLALRLTVDAYLRRRPPRVPHQHPVSR